MCVIPSSITISVIPLTLAHGAMLVLLAPSKLGIRPVPTPGISYILNVVPSTSQAREALLPSLSAKKLFFTL